MMGRQPWSEEKAGLCFRLRGEGLSFSQIAHELGVSRAAVSGYLDRHGADRLKSTPKPPEPRKARPPRPPGLSGTYSYEVPKYRRNDDRLHLTLMLAAMREARAA